MKLGLLITADINYEGQFIHIHANSCKITGFWNNSRGISRRNLWAAFEIRIIKIFETHLLKDSFIIKYSVF